MSTVPLSPARTGRSLSAPEPVTPVGESGHLGLVPSSSTRRGHRRTYSVHDWQKEVLDRQGAGAVARQILGPLSIQPVADETALESSPLKGRDVRSLSKES